MIHPQGEVLAIVILDLAQGGLVKSSLTGEVVRPALAYLEELIDVQLSCCMSQSARLGHDA
jgi:hypothetical protein